MNLLEAVFSPAFVNPHVWNGSWFDFSNSWKDRSDEYTLVLDVGVSKSEEDYPKISVEGRDMRLSLGKREYSFYLPKDSDFSNISAELLKGTLLYVRVPKRKDAAANIPVKRID